MRVDLLKSPSTVVAFFDSVDGKMILDGFQEKYDHAMRQLRRGESLADLRYAQGILDALTLLLDIKKEIREHQEKVRVMATKKEQP